MEAMRGGRRWWWLGAGVWVSVACAPVGDGGAPAPGTHTPTVVQTWSRGTEEDTDALVDGRSSVRLTPDRRLEIVLDAAATCPRFPDLVTVTAPGVLTITSTMRVQVAGQSGVRDGRRWVGCTADISSVRSVVAVPDGIDVTRPFRVVVDGLEHVVGAGAG